MGAIMTRPRRFDPFRPVDLLTSLWSATAMVHVRRFVVGRRLTLRLDGADLTMTVTELSSRLDARGLATGHVEDFTATVERITWCASYFDRARVTMRNVRVRPGAPPVLVAAPVDLMLDVPAAAVDDLLRAAAPRISAAVGADGVARVRLARRPRLGHLEVEARLDGSTLWLSARRAGLGRWRWRLPARIPAYPVQLPEMAHGLQLTSLTFAPGVVRVSGRLPEWRADLL